MLISFLEVNSFQIHFKIGIIACSSYKVFPPLSSLIVDRPSDYDSLLRVRYVSLEVRKPQSRAPHARLSLRLSTSLSHVTLHPPTDHHRP